MTPTQNDAGALAALVALIAELDALEAKATAGPWAMFGEGSIRKPGGLFADDATTQGKFVCRPDEWEDAEFIAALRNAYKTLRTAALEAERVKGDGSWGWVIRHADGNKWRTLDSLGMPDWTDDESKALCLRLREHADAYASDDPEDVRIVPASAESANNETIRAAALEEAARVCDARAEFIRNDSGDNEYFYLDELENAATAIRSLLQSPAAGTAGRSDEESGNG